MKGSPPVFNKDNEEWLTEVMDHEGQLSPLENLKDKVQKSQNRLAFSTFLWCTFRKSGSYFVNSSVIYPSSQYFDKI